MGLLKPNIHYTVDDYETWEGRWELWYGTAVAMSPSPATRHGEAVVRASSLLLREIDAGGSGGGGAGCACQVLAEIDWRVSIDTVVRPDISVVCGDRIDHSHINRPPTLIVEVLSPATRSNDWSSKRNLYAVHGVDWYLLLDPETGRLHCLKRAGADYDEQDASEGQHAMELHERCIIELPAQLSI